MTRLIAMTVFLLPVFCQAAIAADIQKDARSLKNAYFSMNIPAGWRMPAPPKEQPLGGLSAAFIKDGSDVAVTLNFLHGDIPAARFAENMAQDMQKNGMKASKPVNERGLYKFTIEGKANGVAFIGSDSGICAATLIFGSNPREADELLKAIRPVNRKLLPESARGQAKAESLR